MGEGGRGGKNAGVRPSRSLLLQDSKKTSSLTHKHEFFFQTPNNLSFKIRIRIRDFFLSEYKVANVGCYDLNIPPPKCCVFVAEAQNKR